jgi:hypothetical protein
MSHSFNARKKLKRKFIKAAGSRTKGMPLFRAEVARIVKERKETALLLAYGGNGKQQVVPTADLPLTCPA